MPICLACFTIYPTTTLVSVVSIITPWSKYKCWIVPAAIVLSLQLSLTTSVYIFQLFPNHFHLVSNCAINRTASHCPFLLWSKFAYARWCSLLLADARCCSLMLADARVSVPTTCSAVEHRTVWEIRERERERCCTLFNKNQAAWYFVRPAQTLKCRTVTIVIRVTSLVTSIYGCIPV